RRADEHAPRDPGRGAVPLSRVRAAGKFLFAGSEKVYVRGVAYGPLSGAGHGFGPRDQAERDLRCIAASGLNAIRTYSVPPAWLLDAAGHHGLRVMVGLPWEQHVAFLDDRRRVRDIERRVAEGVRACAGHPAVLCHVVGNEIPASIVRWYG